MSVAHNAVLFTAVTLMVLLATVAGSEDLPKCVEVTDGGACGTWAAGKYYETKELVRGYPTWVKSTHDGKVKIVKHDDQHGV